MKQLIQLLAALALAISAAVAFLLYKPSRRQKRHFIRLQNRTRSFILPHLPSLIRRFF